jgi:hypothetical protein
MNNEISEEAKGHLLICRNDRLCSALNAMGQPLRKRYSAGCGRSPGNGRSRRPILPS